MKIALTIWGNRISPVFDSAKNLLIVDVKNSKITRRVYEQFNPHVPSHITTAFQNYKIHILICGAISDDDMTLVAQNGIELISFVTGNVDKVLAAFINDREQISEYLMPGVVFDAVSRGKTTFY